MFNIAFIKKCDSQAEIALAEITMGDFSERFESSLEFWHESEYQQQWVEGIARVVDHKTDSCLIASLTNPRSANFVFWWPIYFNQELVVFQNQVLFLDECVPDFDVENPYRSLRPRKTESEGGERISEWSVPIGDLKSWLERSR